MKKNQKYIQQHESYRVTRVTEKKITAQVLPFYNGSFCNSVAKESVAKESVAEESIAEESAEESVAEVHKVQRP